MDKVDTLKFMFTPYMVILHCSATPDYQIGSPGFDRFRAKDIDFWHKQRGWRMIGYHFVITRAGQIENGRPITECGAHCEGYNINSIGVCYIGTKDILPNQIKSLHVLYDRFLAEFGINQAQWFCHNNFNTSKICPGFDRVRLLEILKK